MRVLLSFILFFPLTLYCQLDNYEESYKRQLQLGKIDKSLIKGIPAITDELRLDPKNPEGPKKTHQQIIKSSNQNLLEKAF